jgi:hypothetical protein
MTRDSLYVTLALVGLGVAFGVLSLLVWLSRGHPGLIRHKLRIGAVMVTLTAILAGGVTRCGATKCYAGPGPPSVSLVGESYGRLVVTYGPEMTIGGTAQDFQYMSLSFRVVDLERTLVQSGDIAALDGSFDDWYEPFEFALSGDVVPGEYLLRMYSCSADVQESSPHSLLREYSLTVQ